MRVYINVIDVIYNLDIINLDIIKLKKKKKIYFLFEHIDLIFIQIFVFDTII
jgi:hypothetical protein